MNTNSPEVWNTIWQREGRDSWRATKLAAVYDRIAQLVPKASTVFDLGGGVGQLADRIFTERKAVVTVVEHNQAAINACNAAGIPAVMGDLRGTLPIDVTGSTVVATEVIEHLEDPRALLEQCKGASIVLVSVPNFALGPEVEPQHARTWTALALLNLLRSLFDADRVRVEVIGGYLLGVVTAKAKSYRLSVTMPVRDEEADIERTLASFRGVADEIVIGIDPRSADATREIASRYAETVFTIEDPSGPEGDRVVDGGVHFAWIRNQCMDRCTGDWIMMTEGHESLAEGQDALLRLDVLPPDTAVCFVLREGQGQRWAFPWLCRNRPDIRYTRSTHNMLDYPNGTPCVRLPQVRTSHDRDHARTKIRAVQRRSQNRKALLEDWMARESVNSLFYLGQEWREHDSDKAISYFRKLLATRKGFGSMRYQARLVLSGLLANKGDLAEARRVLIHASEDDWERTEHFMRLGDLAAQDEQIEQALQWYRLAASRFGDPPFSMFWYDIGAYSWLIAQRLAAAHAELGHYQAALEWAHKAEASAPADSPPEFRAELTAAIAAIEGAMSHAA